MFEFAQRFSGQHKLRKLLFYQYAQTGENRIYSNPLPRLSKNAQTTHGHVKLN